MAHEIITALEYRDWKKDKVTKALIEGLDNNCKAIMNNWSAGAFQLEDAGAAANKNAEMLGQFRAFSTLLEAITTNNVVPIQEEE